MARVQTICTLWAAVLLALDTEVLPWASIRMHFLCDGFLYHTQNVLGWEIGGALDKS